MRDNLCLLIYNHKKQNGRYLFIGAKSMPYHRSKKVLFLPYLSFETKKSFLGGGWGVVVVVVVVGGWGWGLGGGVGKKGVKN